MIASTATNWIGAGAAAVGALGAIAVVILGVIVARRQGKIEASQLEISKQLRELDEQRFILERTPMVVVEESGQKRRRPATVNIEREGAEYIVTLQNVGRGAALGILVQVVVHRDATSNQSVGYIDCDLLMPGEAKAFPVSVAGQRLEGMATISGFCADVDGKRHEIPALPSDPVAP